MKSKKRVHLIVGQFESKGSRSRLRRERDDKSKGILIGGRKNLLTGWPINYSSIQLLNQSTNQLNLNLLFRLIKKVVLHEMVRLVGKHLQLRFEFFLPLVDHGIK